MGRVWVAGKMFCLLALPPGRVDTDSVTGMDIKEEDKGRTVSTRNSIAWPYFLLLFLVPQFSPHL